MHAHLPQQHMHAVLEELGAPDDMVAQALANIQVRRASTWWEACCGGGVLLWWAHCGGASIIQDRLLLMATLEFTG